jgi:hypothetical protein
MAASIVFSFRISGAAGWYCLCLSLFAPLAFIGIHK